MKSPTFPSSHSSRVQAFELVLVLLALVTFRASAQDRDGRQATEAEVVAGANVKAYVNPSQLAAHGGGGGSQTPWTGDIAGAGHSLSGVGNLSTATLWATNMVTSTNAFAGTLVDFNKAESRTNLGGNLTFTGVANVTAGALNSCVISMAANGADRTIVWPAGFHMSRGSTGVVTNGTVADFLIRLQPGVWTNVSQLDSL